jgi:hypothetical protein
MGRVVARRGHAQDGMVWAATHAQEGRKYLPLRQPRIRQRIQQRSQAARPWRLCHPASSKTVA